MDFCSCECKMLNSVPASELFDRLTTYWTTLSGINAFVAAFSWAAFVSNDGPASVPMAPTAMAKTGNADRSDLASVFSSVGPLDLLGPSSMGYFIKF